MGTLKFVLKNSTTKTKTFTKMGVMCKIPNWAKSSSQLEHLLQCLYLAIQLTVNILAKKKGT
jgi:hypothetical protein